MDTENAQKIEAIKINDSAGLLVEKNGFSSLAWNDGSNFFWLRGEIDSAELIKVAEGLKPLGNSANEPEAEYTFVDPENYNYENAYAPTYMTEEFVQTECNISSTYKIHTYTFGDKFIYIEQNGIAGGSHIDTENAQVVKEIVINGSQALYVEKGGLAYITWSFPDTLLFVCGNIDGKEIIKVAEGLKPLGNYASEPEEEYTFIDPEHYNYENAYAPTYMTKEFVQTECSIGTDIKIHTYTLEDKYIYIEQSGITAGSHIDTENAQVVKEIVINGSQALYVEKDGLAYITWSFPDALLFVCGNIDGKEIVKVAEGIKPLGNSASEPEEEYTFVDPELYDWEGAYAPTYIPNGYLHSEIIDIENEKIIIYSKEETEIIFSQSVNTTIEKIDTEDAEIVKKIIIGDSEGLFVVKGDVTSIFWSSEETLLSIVGNADSDEMLKMAQGIKPVN